MIVYIKGTAKELFWKKRGYFEDIYGHFYKRNIIFVWSHNRWSHSRDFCPFLDCYFLTITSSCLISHVIHDTTSPNCHWLISTPSPFYIPRCTHLVDFLPSHLKLLSSLYVYFKSMVIFWKLSHTYDFLIIFSYASLKTWFSKKSSGGLLSPIISHPTCGLLIPVSGTTIVPRFQTQNPVINFVICSQILPIFLQQILSILDFVSASTTAQTLRPV